MATRAGRLAILVLAMLLVGICAGPAVSEAGPLPGSVTDTVEGQVPAVSLGLTAVNPRLLSRSADLLIIGLLLLLYFYRRQLYILYWIGGWVLAAAASSLVATTYTMPWMGPMAFGLSQFLAIVSALAFVMSADAFRSRPKLRRTYAFVLVPMLLWFVLAPLRWGLAASFAPGYLLAAGGLAAAGLAYLALLRRTRMLGAGLIGTVMLLLAISNIWLALRAPQPESTEVINVVLGTIWLHLVTALGMQLMTFEDMTLELRATNKRLKAAQGDLQQLVTTDALTGCRNRRFFDEVIVREMHRHRRYRIPLSLLFADVDRFKAVNDRFGHEAGDRVLQQVAAFLMSHVREADYVFRWGGDEFLIVISCTEKEAARKGADLQAAFARSSPAGEYPVGVGLSVGVAEVTPDVTDVMEVVNLADERMYHNKKAPRVMRA